jgi:hypothetical protein
MNMKRTSLILLSLLLLATPAALQAQTSNLVLNGGFETGDFTGWTLSGANTPASVDNGSYGLFSEITPHSGNYDADFESDGNALYQYLSQTLPTTPGASYLLSVWFDNDPLNFGGFILSWDGNTLLETEGVGPVLNAATWTEMQFVVSAAGNSADLQFGFADLNSIIALDDISVVAVPPDYVSFTASPPLGWIPLTVNFTAAGVDTLGNTITSWNWTFGDGSASTAQNPSHTYSVAGTFAPSLIATNNVGGMVAGVNNSPPGSISAGILTPYSNLVLNGGFETGNFTYWNVSGNGFDVDNGSCGSYSGITPHSGNYEADFESDGSALYQYLSQTLPTTPGASYLLSFWFDNDPLNFGDFLLSWNGNTILDTEGVGTVFYATNWMDLQFVVSATGSNTVLQFGIAGDNSIIALDDISVVAEPPVIANLNLAGTNLVVNGAKGVSGATSYVLMSTNPAQPLNQWVPVATNTLGASGIFRFIATNAVDPNAAQQFYILQAQ